MNGFDFQEFILYGILQGKKIIGKSKDSVVEFLGEPIVREDYQDQNFYFHYQDGLRIAFFDGVVKNYGILFKNLERDLALGTESVNNDYLLHQFIFATENILKAQWTIRKDLSDSEYLVLQINNTTLVYFYLYDGTIERIIYS